MSMQPGEFHWRDGWYFIRFPDGRVQIRRETDPHSSVIAVIPAIEWDSITHHLKRKPVYCRHCPFAEHLHDGAGTPPGCPGFEAQ